MPCVRVTTARGIALECSETAPILCTDGAYRQARSALGGRVVTLDGGKEGSDVVTRVVPIGQRNVRHITFQNDVFWAGAESGRYLGHHNLKPLKP